MKFDLFANEFDAYLEPDFVEFSSTLIKGQQCEQLIHSNTWYLYVNFFRMGNYEDAERKVQEGWCRYCEKILPMVNKEWAKELNYLNKYVSNICSVSDEAFAVEVGRTNMGHWIYVNLNKRRGDISKFQIPRNLFTPYKLTPDRKLRKEVRFNHVVHNISPNEDAFMDLEPINDPDGEDDYDNNGNDSGIEEDDDDNTNGEEDDDFDNDNNIMVKPMNLIEDDYNNNGNNGNEEGDDVDEAGDDGDEAGDVNMTDFDLEADLKALKKNVKYNQMDERSYYDTFKKYMEMKTTDYDNWLSWDKGFYNYITNSQQTKACKSVAVKPKKDSVLVKKPSEEIDLEPWCE